MAQVSERFTLLEIEVIETDCITNPLFKHSCNKVQWL